MSTSNSTTTASKPVAASPPLAYVGGMAKPGKSLPARPPKIAPSHPGVGIKDILDDNHVSYRAAASAMDISHTYLNKVMGGKSPVTAELAVRLEAYFGNGPNGADLFLNRQREFDLWHARKKLAKLVAGIVPLPHTTD